MRNILFSTLLLISLSGNALVDEPAGCWKAGKFPCALKSAHKSEKIQWKGHQLMAAPETSWILSEKTLRLLKGHLWVHSEGVLSVETSYLQFDVDGEFWLSHREDRSELKNLDATITKIEAIPVGFENWYSGISTKGERVTGTLRPIESRQFLALWIGQMHIELPVALETIKNWKELWKNSVESSAAIYQQAVSRFVASEQQHKEVAKSRQRSAEEERQMLRRLYRANNGLPAEGP